jgi:mannose-6-phosphate isomerase-like protein (cupin superfamily)
MTEQLIEMGLRIAALRDICGFTAEDIAKKLDMTVEEYSAYEKGERDFSFSFLYNVASIMEVDVLDIMGGESPKLSGCAIVRKSQGYYVKKQNEYEYKHLAYTFKDKKAEPFLVTVTPKSMNPTMHSHEGQEFNYVVSGKMKFYIGDVSYELEKGDSVYFDSSIPHAERAMGDKPTKFVAVVIK